MAITRVWKGVQAEIGPVRVSLYWNQFAVGVLYDKGRILPLRWLVLLLGCFVVSIPVGRDA